MMRKIFAFVVLIALAACRNETHSSIAAGDSPSAPAVAKASATPEELGRLGAAIRKNPDEAQKLLSAAGLDAKSFEQAIRDVSSDPARSRRYAAAYRAAGN